MSCSRPIAGTRAVGITASLGLAAITATLTGTITAGLVGLE